jgi:hypothetical protein
MLQARVYTRDGTMNRRTLLKALLGTGAATLAPAALHASPELTEAARYDAATTAASAGAPPSSPAPAFEALPFGEVKPEGWIKQQMLRDLRQGFAGCLGQLCHEASSDIFVSNRNSLATQNTANKTGINWWNGETEGNWRAGFMMMAYLSEDPATMREADEYVAHILASQDADGYLGIFAPDSRYQHPGELWTQACLFRGLVAYAQLAGRPDVLHAVRRAVDLTVKVYGSRQRPLPLVESHDLMIVDVLEALCAIEDNPRYRKFAAWYYDEWSRRESERDAALPSLLDVNRPFFDHGVHTYENVRVPLWLASVTGRTDLRRATENAFLKIARYSEVSGSAVSQEMIANRPPDPSLSEYEYCATKELQFTFTSALQKTGRAAFGDRVETIWFNAAQGARLPDGSAISYLTSDNRPWCDERDTTGSKPEKRNKFSPTHEDVAVCCNPNATQVAALFVRAMWMRHPRGGLLAALYGPCRVRTQVDGVAVALEEQTLYPFENTVRITVHPEREHRFPLYFRNPQWSRATRVLCAGAAVERHGDYWRVTRRWRSGDTVRLEFTPEVREIPSENGESALHYGALLFAQPLPSSKRTLRHYPLPHFEDSIYDPGKSTEGGLGFSAAEPLSNFAPAPGDPGADPSRPFDAPLVVLRGPMVAQGASQPQPVTLVPLGNASLLRRLTFPRLV